MSFFFLKKKSLQTKNEFSYENISMHIIFKDIVGVNIYIYIYICPSGHKWR